MDTIFGPTHRMGTAGASPILICFSHLRWNFVYQRPQHLLGRAAKEFEVFYFEEPVFTQAVGAVLREIRTSEGVTVLTPLLQFSISEQQAIAAQEQLLEQFLSGLGAVPSVGWYYTPMALRFTRHFKSAVTVYDNMDELSKFRGAPTDLVALEDALLERADVVFTGGRSLYEAKKNLHPNIHAFPSSVDRAHFSEARNPRREDPPDQRVIAGPRLGFFGVIDERMDLELVSTIADAKPDWSLIMIGPVAKIDPTSLPRRPNIHWLGHKQYSELPEYLGGWNAGIMPFALNESTRFISPTKTPEFLAAGLPVVSTPIADVVSSYGRSGLVEIATTPEEFIKAAARAIETPSPNWIARADQHLQSESWDATWQRMRDLIRGAASLRLVMDVTQSVDGEVRV
jgi:glycosyltransferase involved in cell wall biosynthesis